MFNVITCHSKAFLSLTAQIYTLPSLLSKKEESKYWNCSKKCIEMYQKCRSSASVCFAAFLNEAGLNFVKKCIKLVETRGDPPP